MIDWKQLPKIDAHIHLTPQDVIDANIEYDGVFITNGSIDDYIEIMKKYNIECAFIMPFNDPYVLSMDFTVETSHKNLSKMIKDKNSKFYCFADIDIRKNIKDTIKEIEKVLKLEEFIGIKIHSTNTYYPIDGFYYEKIFEYASKNNILIEIHSYPRDHLSDDVCSPSRIKNILSKYPNLRLSIAHLGGFQYEELIGLNAYFNMSATLPDMVNKLGIEKTNRILRSLGVDKLIFASDYPDSRCLKPNEIYDKYFEILEQMDFSQEEAEKICKYNALKMIGKI